MILQPKVLSDSQIEQIREATEEVIETTGLRVAHPEARALAKRAGARVDEDAERVRIPPPLLRELLAQAPASFTIVGSGGQETALGSGGPFCVANSTDPAIVDYETRRPRKPCLDDLRRHATIAQKLDCVVASHRMDFPVTDVAGPTSSLRALEQYMLHQNKHLFVYVTSVESFHQYLDLGRILLRGEDLKDSGLMTVAVALLSPLAITHMNVELLMGACEHDFAVVSTSCPIAGTTSPYSLASTLVMGNAENLFLAALTQIVKPGNPYLYAFGPSVTEMRSGHELYYTPEKVLWKLATVQLARSYRLPIVTECGGTQTHRYDQQNGAEGILFMLTAHASGADLMAGIGSCLNAYGMSAEMMVIQATWLDMAKFLCRGIGTDELRMGVKNIMDAGPGGNFLTDDLTLEFLRGGEFFANDLLDFSGGYSEQPSLLEQAHAKVEELVADAESPHPGQVREDLKRYFHDEYCRIEKKGA